MAVLTPEMKELIQRMRGACYIATSSKAGIPNVSLKDTTKVVDDNTLAFACLMSEHTISNLKENPNIALAVADPAAGKAYQFKGVATLEDKGSLFDEMATALAARKLPRPKCVARVAVKEVFPYPPKK